ncbi:hypothetical protein [Streptomyces avicenniae]|nr:hypothetical protein [Streptomyces avicenniae]
MGALRCAGSVLGVVAVVGGGALLGLVVAFLCVLRVLGKAQEEQR